MQFSTKVSLPARSARDTHLLQCKIYWGTLHHNKLLKRLALLCEAGVSQQVSREWCSDIQQAARSSLLIFSPSSFKIEALIWVSFGRALKCQPFSWRAGSNSRRQSKKWNTKLVINLSMNYMVHVSNTIRRIKSQPSISASCSDNALGFQNFVWTMHNVQIIVRTSSDVFISTSGLRHEGMFLERYTLKGWIAFDTRATPGGPTKSISPTNFPELHGWDSSWQELLVAGYPPFF